MCRNIQRLRRLEPPVTESDIHEASYNLARKIGGCFKPPQKFQSLVEDTAREISNLVQILLTQLEIDGRKPCVEILKN